MPDVPPIIIENLKKTREAQPAYIYAFCILPNHMHLLLSPFTKGISKFMQSFKSNVVKDVRAFLASQRPGIAAAEEKRPGVGAAEKKQDRTVVAGKEQSEIVVAVEKYGVGAAGEKFYDIAWQQGYYDERIQTSRQRSNTVHYITGNAMKHRLVNDIMKWPWTSLHFQEMLDPMEVWID